MLAYFVCSRSDIADSLSATSKKVHVLPGVYVLIVQVVVQLVF